MYFNCYFYFLFNFRIVNSARKTFAEFLIREHDEKKKFLLQKVRELGRSESTMDVRDSTKNLLPPPPSAPVSSSR